MQRKMLILMDSILAGLVLILLAFVKMEYVITIAFLMCIPYLYATKRKELVPYFGIAIAIALVWGMAGHNYYDYTGTWKVFGLTLFPFVVWSISLFWVFMLHRHLAKRLRLNVFWKELLSFAALFWVLLLGVETLVYHAFSLKNIATSSYPGLPLCNCIHAPLGMQIVYLLMGPAYFAICYYVRKRYMSGKLN